jgi:selenocysteine lyase/cysteine desulfurase
MPWRDDASRLEAGNPSLLGLAVLDNALQRLEPLDPGDVERHAQGMGRALIQGLRTRGFTVITPEVSAERAGNVCFLATAAPGLAARLAPRGVLVWGGEGRIRVSPHVHCDPADIDHFFDALDHVGRSPASSPPSADAPDESGSARIRPRPGHSADSREVSSPAS